MSEEKIYCSCYSKEIKTGDTEAIYEHFIFGDFFFRKECYEKITVGGEDP